MRQTFSLLVKSDFPAIQRRKIETLQVNLGYVCNQTCVHCHVNAGPKRTESMALGTVNEVLGFLAHGRAGTLDLTGGAPELNPHFRYLVRRARSLGVNVIDRCNLTILFEKGQESLDTFLAENSVEVVASLPCYTEELVDRQRGKGVYEASIRAIRRLNELGYAREGSGLALNLVYNPQGATLPPSQAKLEADYRRILGEQHGIVFNRLYVLANMPIKRFGSALVSKGQFHHYMEMLRAAHRDENLDGVMCRSLVSVDWRGYLYDCDFNQMLGMPLGAWGKPRMHIRDLIAADVEGNPIVVADHCYGCTAGQGSSCGGTLA